MSAETRLTALHLAVETVKAPAVSQFSTEAIVATARDFDAFLIGDKK
jgi:hypothetical protein